MGTTAKKHIKGKHKIELGPPGTIDSTYTVRQFLTYEVVVIDGGSIDSANAAIEHTETPADLDKAMTFAEWQKMTA